MKTMRFVISTLLLFAMLLPALCACGGPVDDPADTTVAGSPEETAEAVDETTSDVAEITTAASTEESSTAPVEESSTAPSAEESSAEESTTEPVEIPTLDLLPFYDGTHTYTLVRPDELVMADNANDVTFLQGVLADLCGEAMPVCEANCESVDTLTVSMYYEGEDMDYAVRISEDGYIELTGGCKETLQRAVYTFLGSFLLKNADGTVSLINTGDFIYDFSEDKIDNSSMLEYIPTDEVTLSPSNPAGDSTLMSPDWMETLVMVEVRLDTASIGGSFLDSFDLIDYYASLGVNGIWLTPVYKFGVSNGYGNSGPHTIDDRFTGTGDDYEAGWLVAKQFVDYAHSKGIYIFLDIVTWGSWGDSPLVTEHPDWYDGMAVWGGPAYNWKNEEFVEWFKQVVVNNIMVTGADGLRCDCEPGHAGYEVFEDIRNRLAEQGKHVMIMAEDKTYRGSAFDMEQDGVLGVNRSEQYYNCYNLFVDGIFDIVTASLRGRGLAMGGGDYRFYTNCICNHDYRFRPTQGNRLKINYAAILAPFIPLWYQGEEFNATSRPEGLYVGLVDHAEIEIPANALFLEDVKAAIRIRRTYPDLFAYWPLKHINTNLCAVEINGWEDPAAEPGKLGAELSAYARYISPDNDKATTSGQAVLVIPNHVEAVSGVGTVTIPLEDAYLEGYTYFKVTDLSTGRVIAYVPSDAPTFTVTIPYNYAGMYLVEGV